MDFERLERMVSLAMRESGGLIAAGLGAVVLLLVAVAVSRMLKKRKMRKQEMMAAAGAEMADDLQPLDLDNAQKVIIDDDIDLPMMQPGADMMADDAGTDAVAQFDIEPTPPDQLDAGLSAEFSSLDDAAMDDLDDITIPQVGEAPPPQKSRFFSASWLHGDKPADSAIQMTAEPDMPAAEDAKPKRHKRSKEDQAAQAAAAECARLAEIERKMLALRELYEAGLIAPEVYVLKAREFAAQA